MDQKYRVRSRIRLHLTEEQVERLKQRAIARHSTEITAARTIVHASEEIAKLREALHAIPIETAALEISKLDLPDVEKAALRVLLK
jgi:DNA-binding protein H-NS